MADRTVFKRYELKYLITPRQKEEILEEVSHHLVPDGYGRSTVRNLYYDTESYLLIRRSMEKPLYKEKLRLRSYSRATEDKKVFAELKKKYKGVVFKRRLALSEGEATRWLSGKAPCPYDTQISREIEYFRKFYSTLRPTLFLSYEREAYFSRDDGSFRLTFDQNVLYRDTDLSLCGEVYGTPLLPEGKILMEIKCGGGIPLWMVSALSSRKIYKTPFSKYGRAYTDMLSSGRIAPTKS